VKLNKDNTFTISTQKVDDADVMPLQNFFSERDYISLLEVLSTVNRYSGFLDEFQHWQQRYHRSKPPQKTFYAGIIGLGCGIGTRKIAQARTEYDKRGARKLSCREIGPIMSRLWAPAAATSTARLTCC